MSELWHQLPRTGFGTTYGANFRCGSLFNSRWVARRTSCADNCRFARDPTAIGGSLARFPETVTDKRATSFDEFRGLAHHTSQKVAPATPLASRAVPAADSCASRAEEEILGRGARKKPERTHRMPEARACECGEEAENDRTGAAFAAANASADRGGVDRVTASYCTGRELRISSIFSSILLRSAGFSK